MKKLLCALIFCLSFISAFAWRVIPLTDEFGDPIKEKAIIQDEGARGIFIRKNGEEDFFILVVSTEGRNSTGKSNDIIKIKIDDFKPFELDAMIEHDWGFATGITRKELDMLANGKKAKFSIPSGYGLKNLEIFDLTGLKEIVHEIY